MVFFTSNTFISNPRLKLAKNPGNAKQHPEAELLLFENYSHSSSTSSSKNKQKNKCVCIHKITRLIIIKTKMKMKNRSHRYDINRSRLRHGHKNSKYQVPQYDDTYMYQTTPKQYVRSLYEKVKQH